MSSKEEAIKQWPAMQLINQFAMLQNDENILVEKIQMVSNGLNIKILSLNVNLLLVV